jgi:hypothetical protein
MTRMSRTFRYALLASLAAGAILIAAIAYYQMDRTPAHPDSPFMRSAR